MKAPKFILIVGTTLCLLSTVSYAQKKNKKKNEVQKVECS